MKKFTVLIALCGALLLNGCSTASSESLSVSSSVSTSSETNTDVLSFISVEKVARLEDFSLVEFSEDNLLYLGSELGVGGANRIATIGQQIFVYSYPHGVTSIQSLDSGKSYIYQVDANTFQVSDIFEIEEKCTVSFVSDSIIIAYVDRIEQYNSDFELVASYNIPSDTNYPSDILNSFFLALDDSHVIYVTEIGQPAIILNLETMTETTMPKFIWKGQELSYWEFHHTGNPDVVSCYSYGPPVTLFVNWKTQEVLFMLPHTETKINTCALSASTFTMYQLETPYIGLLEQTIDQDGIYETHESGPYTIYDCVTKKQLQIPACDGIDFVYSSSVRENSEQVYFIIGMAYPQEDKIESYLYRLYDESAADEMKKETFAFYDSIESIPFQNMKYEYGGSRIAVNNVAWLDAPGNQVFKGEVISSETTVFIRMYFPNGSFRWMSANYGEDQTASAYILPPQSDDKEFVRIEGNILWTEEGDGFDTETLRWLEDGVPVAETKLLYF